MIEVKEIRNTLNGKEFISKDYLRSEAFSYLNHCAKSISRMAQQGSCVLNDDFSGLNGAVWGYNRIDIITKEEGRAFLDAVMRTMYDEKEFTAYIDPCGLVSLKYIGKINA